MYRAHRTEGSCLLILQNPFLATLGERAIAVPPEFSLARRLLTKIRGSQFNRNMGAGSVMALIGVCLSIISYPIYLHYLGYHRYGLWLVLSVVVSIAQLGNLGIPWALMKLVAEEHGRGDWEGVKTYVNIGCGIILAVGLIFVGAVVLMRYNIIYWFKLGGTDAVMVYSMLPYVAMLSILVLLFSTFNAALGGLGRMDLTSYNETLVQILIIVFCSVLLYLGLDLAAMVLGTLLGYTLAQVISFMQLQKIMPIALLAHTRITRDKARRLLGTGGWILGGGVCSMMVLPFTRLMLSRYAGLEAVAVNDMCLTGSMRVRSIFDSAFRPMMPEVSSLLVNGREGLHDRVRSIDRKAFLIILTVALPTFIGLMIVMNPLLHIWLHRSFNPLLPNTFRIALVGAFASLLGSSAYYMLIGLGNARDSAYATAIQFIVNGTVLLAIALCFKRITVGEAAMAFAIATGATTMYLRARIHILTQPIETRLTPISARGNDANS
jgi:O-antigen/teichoic acid export membrane protein